MRIVLWAFLLAGCGGNSTGPEPVLLQSEVVIEGLTGAAQVDSVDWQPISWSPTGSGEIEITGTYRMLFRNLTDQNLEIRYDLRFFDQDTFFIDVFIPFDLPRRLGPQELRQEQGEFFIRTSELRHLDDLQTMRITAAVQQAQ